MQRLWLAVNSTILFLLMLNYHFIARLTLLGSLGRTFPNFFFKFIVYHRNHISIVVVVKFKFLITWMNFFFGLKFRKISILWDNAFVYTATRFLFSQFFF